MTRGMVARSPRSWASARVASDVEVERLAVGAGLLGAVEHGHLAHARGQRGEQLGRRERPVQPQLEHPDPLATTDEVGHRLAHRLSGRPHDDDDPVGLRVAGVLGDPVVPAGVRRRPRP